MTEPCCAGTFNLATWYLGGYTISINLIQIKEAGTATS
jgi:hypothetical protein